MILDRYSGESMPYDEEEAIMRQPATRVGRRRFLAGSLGLVATATLRGQSWAQGGAPAVITSDARRPGLPYGVMSGDITSDRAIVWSRADRPARMVLEWATNEGLRDARRVVGPAALADGDFTARVDLAGLPPGQDIFYRVSFQDLADVKIFSAPARGRFRTAPTARRTVRFCFSGDEAGQGWGINREWGGLKLYEVMRRAQPDFFIHSGDQIYADNPIKAEV